MVVGQQSSAVIGLASPRRRRRGWWVAPTMAAAVVLLLGGLWEGLVYLGFPLPADGVQLHAEHGPLMVLGFFGTLISLERAVALGSVWAYLAPACASLGAVLVGVGAPAGVGEALVTLGGVALVGIFVAVHRIQPSVHNGVLAVGAACWVVAAGLWEAGWDIPRIVPWLAGFLILTITGERLELSRLAGARPGPRRLFIAAGSVFVAGLLVSLGNETMGVRLAGIGMCALAAWLARYDIARRTVRLRGLTRFMAAALLPGYVWLAVGGVLWVAFGRMAFVDLGTAAHGSSYDAMLHAVFIGFVLSMVFAHATVIVPSVLGRPFPYHPSLYAPLALLHASLILRLLGGDAFGNVAAWQWGGILNETALLAYLVWAICLIARGRTRPAARVQRARRTTPPAPA